MWREGKDSHYIEEQEKALFHDMACQIEGRNREGQVASLNIHQAMVAGVEGIWIGPLADGRQWGRRQLRDTKTCWLALQPGGEGGGVKIGSCKMWQEMVGQKHGLTDNTQCFLMTGDRFVKPTGESESKIFE